MRSTTLPTFSITTFNPSSKRWMLTMLPARLLLFLMFQALIAIIYAAGGSTNAWEESAAWWAAAVTLTNFICLAFLVRFFRQEGGSYWNIFHIEGKYLKHDLLMLLAMSIVTGPVAMLPNTMLATALYGDSLAPVRQFLTPVPPLGLFFALVLFPITQGLVELPYYFRYIMLRLSKQINPWAAFTLSALFLGIQHVTVPLRFDNRFFLWRLVMYLPFAFLIGLLIKWRPRMLPYFAIIHVLIDFATAVMYLTPF